MITIIILPLFILILIANQNNVLYLLTSIFQLFLIKNDKYYYITFTHIDLIMIINNYKDHKFLSSFGKNIN